MPKINGVWVSRGRGRGGMSNMDMGPMDDEIKEDMSRKDQMRAAMIERERVKRQREEADPSIAEKRKKLQEDRALARRGRLELRRKQNEERRAAGRKNQYRVQKHRVTLNEVKNVPAQVLTVERPTDLSQVPEYDERKKEMFEKAFKKAVEDLKQEELNQQDYERIQREYAEKKVERQKQREEKLRRQDEQIEARKPNGPTLANKEEMKKKEFWTALNAKAGLGEHASLREILDMQRAGGWDRRVHGVMESSFVAYVRWMGQIVNTWGEILPMDMMSDKAFEDYRKQFIIAVKDKYQANVYYAGKVFDWWVAALQKTYMKMLKEFGSEDVVNELVYGEEGGRLGYFVFWYTTRPQDTNESREFNRWLLTSAYGRIRSYYLMYFAIRKAVQNEFTEAENLQKFYAWRERWTIGETIDRIKLGAEQYQSVADLIKEIGEEMWKDQSHNLRDDTQFYIAHWMLKNGIEVDPDAAEYTAYNFVEHYANVRYVNEAFPKDT